MVEEKGKREENIEGRGAEDGEFEKEERMRMSFSLSCCRRC